VKLEGPLASEGVAQHEEALKLLKIFYWFVVLLTLVTREVLRVWVGSHVGEKTFQVDSGLEVNPNLKSQKMKDHHLPDSLAAFQI